jgi:hypothetical protein
VTATTIPRIEFEHAADEAGEARAGAGEVRFLVIPRRRYLAVDGDAPPGSEVYQRAISSLFPVAYGVHFALRARGVSAPIGHLHGLYWFDAESPVPLEAFAAESEGPPGSMKWRLIISLPDAADDGDVASAVDAARAKRPDGSFDTPQLITWEEGPSAQILHVGAYEAERPTIARLHAAIDEAGLEPVGAHHEIYLSDPRTPPERTRTVIRQAVAERGRANGR